MATQRLTIATIGGNAADTLAKLFQSWQADAECARDAVDLLCEQLRAHSSVLPIVYFCEWIDRWLMGDLIPGPGAVDGKRFQAACMLAEQALSWAGRCGDQFPENEWLTCRLREASEGWRSVVEPKVLIVMRELLGASTTDEEVRKSLHLTPEWLSTICGNLK